MHLAGFIICVALTTMESGSPAKQNGWHHFGDERTPQIGVPRENCATKILGQGSDFIVWFAARGENRGSPRQCENRAQGTNSKCYQPARQRRIKYRDNCL
jgi:hypothetical protein